MIKIVSPGGFSALGNNLVITQSDHKSVHEDKFIVWRKNMQTAALTQKYKKHFLQEKRVTLVVLGGRAGAYFWLACLLLGGVGVRGKHVLGQLVL